MNENTPKSHVLRNRALRTGVLERVNRKLGRLVVLTGARQTGKTTLVQASLADWPYFSMDDPALRPVYTRMSAAEWVERYPRAIIDEVQKTPSIIETIKAAHDSAGHVRYLLLGSSQILLLSKVKESLAGRATIMELWPLTLPEMSTSSWDEPVAESRLISWLMSGTRDESLLSGVPAASRLFARHTALFESYLRFGGMPALIEPDLSEVEREDWLRDYRRTYLERDVTDLANLADLEPFVLAQNAIAAKTGTTVNFSDLARTAQISPSTARRFLRYLELSYQVILLPPYFQNREKRLVKMPVVHFLDPGLMRAVLGHRGEPTGQEFESAVVAEIFKQIRNASLPIGFHHLRTYDGREVDLLLELDTGFVAVEIKMTRRVSDTDARHLVGLADLLPKPVLASFILSMDPDARRLARGTWALPAAWALGAALL